MHAAWLAFLELILTIAVLPAAVCQTLRILSFSSTQLPGPNYHCRLPEVTAVRPMPLSWWGHLVVDVAKGVSNEHACMLCSCRSHYLHWSYGIICLELLEPNWQQSAGTGRRLLPKLTSHCSTHLAALAFSGHAVHAIAKIPSGCLADHPRLWRPHLLVSHHLCAGGHPDIH